MAYSITTKQIAAQPALVVRGKVKRPEIGKMIGESLPLVFQCARRRGVELGPHPFARYLEMGPEMTIEAGMTVIGGVPSGEGDVLADTLPGGLAAVTLHQGPYDKLPDAFAAMHQWIEAEGFRPNGAPWELYVNDPGEFPDPKDWMTEVYCPVALR
jgi:AraC family transcriptional regulator